MAQEVPTFKLVLVGDGGTGKVSKNTLFATCPWAISSLGAFWRLIKSSYKY
jgi:hypothetical protein